MVCLEKSAAGYPDPTEEEDDEDAYDDGDEDYEDYDYSEDPDPDEDQDVEYEEGGCKTENKDETFSVVTVEGIQKQQSADICSVSAVLAVSRDVAILLLLHFKWNLIRAKEEWFSDEEGIRKAIGFLSDPVAESSSSIQKPIRCRISFEDFDVNQMSAASCGHLFCNVCWNSYISISINDGPGCLYLQCPDPLCNAAVGESMLKLVWEEKDKNRYRNYLMRSYVESSSNLKWCPAPDCVHAIEYVSGSDNFDVKCDCSYSFCWNCLEEIHRPVDCETVANWNYKNTNEDNNMEWLLANSKPCPKCKKPIEKNHGCMHMVCADPCKHQFCWLCLGPWKKHNDSYSCNKYKEEKKQGKFSEEEKKRRAAKESVKRYAHFFQRWAANEVSRKLSVKRLKELENGLLEKICGVQKVFITDIEYITKAWEQIIECRRVLKWAYAYGYYIPVEKKVKRRFYEYTQGEAELNLERLHKYAEEDVMKYANATSPSSDFVDLREKLTRMTEVTRNYFDRLVRALENGLEDVESMENHEDDSLEEGLDGWICNSCSMFNSLDSEDCEACSQLRGTPALDLEDEGEGEGEGEDDEDDEDESEGEGEPNRLEPELDETGGRIDPQPETETKTDNEPEPEPNRLEPELGEIDGGVEPEPDPNRLEPVLGDIDSCVEPDPKSKPNCLEPELGVIDAFFEPEPKPEPEMKRLEPKLGEIEACIESEPENEMKRLEPEPESEMKHHEPEPEMKRLEPEPKPEPETKCLEPELGEMDGSLELAL